MKLIGDADFIWFLSNSIERDKHLSSLSGLKERVVITPNAVEFERLYDQMFDNKCDKRIAEIAFFDKNINTFGPIDST